MRNMSQIKKWLYRLLSKIVKKKHNDLIIQSPKNTKFTSEKSENIKKDT